MTLGNFVRIVWTLFEKIEMSKKGVFGHFGATFGYVCQILVIQFQGHCAQRTVQKWLVFGIFSVLLAPFLQP